MDYLFNFILKLELLIKNKLKRHITISKKQKPKIPQNQSQIHK